MINDESAQELMPDVRTAARTVAREWAGVIDEDDAEQEIWVHLLERLGTLDTITEMDRPLRISSLTAIGRQIASQYRDDLEMFSGNYTYGTAKVRGMLGSGALGDPNGDYGTHASPIWEMPESVIEQLQRTDRESASERIDLFLGLKQLHRINPRYGYLISQKYIHWVEFDNDDPDRKACDRAVDALVREMNRVRVQRGNAFEQGPGTRK